MGIGPPDKNPSPMPFRSWPHSGSRPQPGSRCACEKPNCRFNPQTERALLSTAGAMIRDRCFGARWSRRLLPRLVAYPTTRHQRESCPNHAGDENAMKTRVAFNVTMSTAPIWGMGLSYFRTEYKETATKKNGLDSHTRVGDVLHCYSVASPSFCTCPSPPSLLIRSDYNVCSVFLFS